MSEDQWTKIDTYTSNLMVEHDAALDLAAKASAEAGLPEIAVAPNQGKFLHLLARTHGARRILEIGAFGGYSAIWLARALPAGGTLTTLEAEPSFAEVARRNIDNAGLSDVVDLRVGKALETLPELAGGEPFDLVFIDADKANIPEYFGWALKLTRPGSVIVVDNVVLDGLVIEADSPNPAVQGVRRFNQLVADEPRVTATTVQTVGSRGHDGFCLMLVES
ncbi:O-methyltransferase [Amycolatopsis sp. WQ 127309]|uniref:O-methyltransferase n=1 Tax=Amycolatopsis sp. WQ 127309 TaxID=2932773 RepID=UPI001FF6EFB8|nr:O-methyltransferase [Amycolatopsis sp. WQ 127309]UOZ04354.1 O-methyltransferase [Amycolatopsis sp. WQ 127309]